MAKKTTKKKQVFDPEVLDSEARPRRAQTRRESLHLEVINQMIALSTSGFGLVAALAWNNVIQEVVNNYVKKFLPNNSGIVSLTLYAVIVTVLAVTVTYQLTHIKDRIEDLHS